MIRKLYLYGIEDFALAWFISYLSYRMQVSKVENTMSSFKPVRCGVPQKSNLWPLLFLLYINDLPNCLKYPDLQYTWMTQILLCMADLQLKLKIY